MKSINYNLGMTEYAVNGDESNPIRLNVRDVNLLKRVRRASEQIKALAETHDGKETLTVEELISLDADVRRIFNEAFGQDICTAAFGDINCMTDTGGGVPLFQAFFDAFLPVVEADIRAAMPQKPAASPKVQQYTAPIITRKQPIAGASDPYGTLDVSGLSKEQKAALIRQLLT